MWRGLVMGLAGVAIVPLGVAAQQFRAVARLESFRATVALDTMTVRFRTEHEAPPAVVWPLLRDAISAMDRELISAGAPASGWMGTLYLRPPRRMGDKSLSFYLDCGMSMTGPHADTDRISLAFAVFADSLPNQRTRLGWALVGSAVRREGFSAPPLTCESTGQLEKELAKRLDNRLAMQP
jgi:hypothetical protein